MKSLHLLLSLLFLTTYAYAGGVKGTVRDASGSPLDYVTIYVPEIADGTVTNSEGYYEIDLPPGDYRLVFQHLGYESKIERITVDQDYRTLDIRMGEQAFELDVIEVLDGGEDPAYTVMRKAIAKADYHRQQVDYYSAQVYIKGAGRFLKAPKIFQRMIEKEDGVRPDSTVAYTSESVSEIEYERPGTFREKVISIYTSGEDADGASPSGYIYGSFYEPDIAETVSPLSPKAFAYYKFELAGYFNDRNYAVNKIKVTPRSPGDDVFTGYIYILEDLWAIHSLELQARKIGINFNIEQVYAPIQEDVWLPISHHFDVEAKLLGFGADFEYLASVSNYNIRINPDLKVDFAVIDEKIDREAARRPKKKDKGFSPEIEQKLENGEELTRKELRQMVRSYEKAEREETEDPTVVSNYSQEVDSLATRRDSSYWATIRPIPLTKAEVRGYEVQDSMAVQAKQEAEDIENGIDTRKRKSNFPIDRLWIGKSFKLAEKTYIHYDGLERFGFNPVEGFWISTDLRFTKRFEKSRMEWSFTPRYGFSNNIVHWKANGAYRFGPSHSYNRIDISGGSNIQQYHDTYPVSEALNSFYALLAERNYVNLYNNRFASVRYRKQWRSTANLQVLLDWGVRDVLNNRTNQTWFGQDDRNYNANRPFVEEARGLNFEDVRAATIDVTFRINPWQKYRIRNGNREPIDDTSPSFIFNYRAGLPGIFDSETEYHRFGVAYEHTWEPFPKGELDMRFEAGGFLNAERVGLADFRHFGGNLMEIGFTQPIGTFSLLPYYIYSTQDYWLQGHLQYEFRQLLVSRIPVLQRLGTREQLFVNYLQTPASDYYTELGYRIDKILGLLRVEAVASFQDGEYLDWGIRVGLRVDFDDSGRVSW